MGDDEHAHLRVVLAQDRHDLFGLRRLGEGREAAQIEEHDGDLATMALQRILGAARENRLGELRREEALESAEIVELRDLRRHPRLERAIELGELVVQRLHAQERAHARQQLRLIDRLRQEIVGPRLDALHPLLPGLERGDHHDGQHRGRAILAQLLAHLVARHARHHHVEQHDVGRLGLDLVERFLARGRRGHGVALGAEEIGEQLDVDRCVVDDEDLLAHRARIASTAAMNSFTLSGFD